MKHLNPDQLRMFMSPRDLSTYLDAYGDFGANKGGLPHEVARSGVKQDNAQRSGMAQSISQEGVKRPVSISHGTADGTTLVNGHHRVMTQSAQDPDRLIPVLHSEGYGGLPRGEWKDTQDTDVSGDKDYRLNSGVVG